MSAKDQSDMISVSLLVEPVSLPKASLPLPSKSFPFVSLAAAYIQYGTEHPLLKKFWVAVSFPLASISPVGFAKCTCCEVLGHSCLFSPTSVSTNLILDSVDQDQLGRTGADFMLRNCRSCAKGGKLCSLEGVWRIDLTVPTTKWSWVNAKRTAGKPLINGETNALVSRDEGEGSADDGFNFIIGRGENKRESGWQHIYYLVIENARCLPTTDQELLKAVWVPGVAYLIGTPCATDDGKALVTDSAEIELFERAAAILGCDDIHHSSGGITVLKGLFNNPLSAIISARYDVVLDSDTDLHSNRESFRAVENTQLSVGRGMGAARDRYDISSGTMPGSSSEVDGKVVAWAHVQFEDDAAWRQVFLRMGRTPGSARECITSGNLEEASKHAFLHNLFHGVGGPSSGLIEMDYETNKTDCRKKKRARTPSVKVAAMFVWPLMEMEVEEVRNREIRAAQDAAAGDVDADGGADGSTGRRGTGGGSKTTAVNPNLEHKAIMKSLVADMLKKTDLEEEVTSKKRHV